MYLLMSTHKYLVGDVQPNTCMCLLMRTHEHLNKSIKHVHVHLWVPANILSEMLKQRRACVLQCVAVCCSVLQCVAVCCSVLQCVAVC